MEVLTVSMYFLSTAPVVPCVSRCLFTGNAEIFELTQLFLYGARAHIEHQNPRPPRGSLARSPDVRCCIPNPH